MNTPLPDNTRSHYNPKPERVVAIINPISGRNMGRRIINLLNQEKWDVDITTFETVPNSYDGHKRAIDYAHKHQAERLLIAGGDGTLMETLTVMFQDQDTPIPISLIPLGTGNIVAGDLDIPRRVMPAIRHALDAGLLNYWDMGEIENTGQKFVLRASVGVEAQTLAAMNTRYKRLLGTIAYALPAMKHIITSKPIEYTLTIDDEKVVTQRGISAFAAVTNLVVPSIVDVVIRHDIQPDDGLLHAGVVHPLEVVKHATDPQKLLKESLIKINDGSVAATSLVTSYPVKKRLKIEADSPQRAQVDGELLDIYTPLTIRNIPRSVPFVTPL